MTEKLNPNITNVKAAETYREARSIIEKADSESRVMTTDERDRVDTLFNEHRDLMKEIEARNYSETVKNQAAITENRPTPSTRKMELASAEIVQEIVKQRRVGQSSKLAEYRSMEMATDEKGGYLVPEKHLEMVKYFSPDQVIVEPRATVLQPDPNNPDEIVKMPFLDQFGGRDLFSDLSLSSISEGGEKNETTLYIDEMQLEPYEIAGHIVCTDKILRNAPALEVLINQVMLNRLRTKKDSLFLTTGRGAAHNEPENVVDHAATYAVNRQNANDITYTDIVNMISRHTGDSGSVFVTNKQSVVRLAHMVDPAGQLIWQPNAKAGQPATLMGLPLFTAPRMNVLGDRGDILLADFSHYIVKRGFGPAFASSEHVLFINNKTIIKLFEMVDGKPWLQSTLINEDNWEFSPFVVLDDGAGAAGGGNGELT